MIFSSSLGSVEKYTTEAAIKSIANHVRRLQEELEYRLAHLDSTNINEINADETTITGGPITLISKNQDEIAKLHLTDQQIVASVQGLGGDVSTLKQTANSLTATVQAQGGSISTLQQTANSLTATVQAQGGSISTLQQTAGSLTATVQSLSGDVSTLKQTASGLTSTVQAQGGKISTLEQTATGLTASVSGLGNQYAALALTVDGFTVTDAGGTTRIKGSSVETETLHVKAANIDGTLTAGQINLSGSISWADLDSGVQSSISNAGGYSKSQIKTFINESLVASPNIAGATFYDLPDSGDLNDSLAFLQLNAEYNSGIVGPVLRYVDNQNGHEAFKIWSWNRHCYMGLCGGLGWMCSPTEIDEDSDGLDCQVYHALGTHAFDDKVRFGYKVEFAPGCEVTGLVPTWG